MFDPEAIRAALAANLATLAAAEGYQVNEYMSPPTPPTIEIAAVEDIDYDIAMQRGGDQNNMLIRAYVAATLNEGAQRKLDRLAASSGATSLKAAVQSDTTLGGACDDLRVTHYSGHLVYGGTVLGGEWTVQVETTG